MKTSHPGDLTLKTLAFGILFFIPVSYSVAEEERRTIEEIIVTAEKREATVSDTSISITAFSEDLVENMGIQSPDEMVNFIPSTTRDAYDIRIRGVGRNFRALGGDPGIATYYNGVYSEDFGIASTESALYDVGRIEVLRGPQGTLYGRNAVGGALNYITNDPTFEWTGEVRTQLGSYDNQELYGILSGPLIDDKLAIRLTATARRRDGLIDGEGSSEDLDSVDDQNYAVALKWNINDDMGVKVRWNDRTSSRVIGQEALTNQGPLGDRGQVFRGYAYGLTPVAAGTPDALSFTNPATGEVVWGAYVRPGVDRSASSWPHNPNPGFTDPNMRLSTDLEDLDDAGLSNNRNDEGFTHNAVQFEYHWDIGNNTLKYVYGYMDFDYTFDYDWDYSESELTNYRQTVLEDVHTWSHEVQYLWEVGDRFTATSGIYMFRSHRTQDYSITDDLAQGRFTRAANYGGLLPFVSWAGEHKPLGRAGDHEQWLGLWGGDPEGDVYDQHNIVENTSYAVYSQGKYQFNDEWAVTIGVRWAEDNKDAEENRFSYFEQPLDSPASWLLYLVSDSCVTFTEAATDPCWSSMKTYDPVLRGDFGPLTTPLATMNVWMGNGAYNFTPSVIDYACDLADPACAAPPLLNGVPFSLSQSTSGDDSWDDVNFRINFDWTPNEDTLVYFGVTTGYRAGGYSLGVTDARSSINPLGPFADLGDPFQYEEETVVSYEVGYKGTLLDSRLQLNLSAYLYDYENYQDRLNVFDAAQGRSVDVVQTAPEAKNAGIEVELTWLATDNLLIGGNYSYTDTEYSADYFVVDLQNPAIPLSLFGPTVENQAVFVKNVKGHPLKRIPEHKATVYGTYTINTASMGTFDVNAMFAFTGEYFTNPLERDVDLIPDRFRTDVGVTWRDPTQKWRVRAFVDNVLDEQYARAAFAAGEGRNYRQVAPRLTPRLYGVDITYEFGG